jgi:hypothetical protein
LWPIPLKEEEEEDKEEMEEEEIFDVLLSLY